MSKRRFANLKQPASVVVKEASQDSEKRQKLITEFTKCESKLKQLGKPFSGIPSISHFEQLLDDAKSDKSGQALSEASEIYETVSHGLKQLQLLQELETKAEHALKARQTSADHKITTFGQALKAVSEAYRTAEATLSDRYHATTKVAESGALLKELANATRNKQSSRTPSSHKSRPWGYFRIAAPILPEDVKAKFGPPTGLPVLRRYAETLESFETWSLGQEGRIVPKEQQSDEEGNDDE